MTANHKGQKHPIYRPLPGDRYPGSSKSVCVALQIDALLNSMLKNFLELIINKLITINDHL